MNDRRFVEGAYGRRRRCLEIAKTVLISETNKQLKSYRIPGMEPGSIWQLLYALRDCGLKNDALLLNLYELIAEIPRDVAAWKSLIENIRSEQILSKLNYG